VLELSGIGAAFSGAFFVKQSNISKDERAAWPLTLLFFAYF
jgi:hypothetical protein